MIWYYVLCIRASVVVTTVRVGVPSAVAGTGASVHHCSWRDKMWSWFTYTLTLAAALGWYFSFNCGRALVSNG